MHTELASSHQPIEYPPFEAPLSTDLLTSVALTGTNHAEDQPVHLRVVKTPRFIEEQSKDDGNFAVGAGFGAVESQAELTEDAGRVSAEVEDELARRRKHVQVNVEQYAGLLGRACPAGVYEYVPDEDSASKEGWNGHKLVINSQVSALCQQIGLVFEVCAELHSLQALRRQGTDTGYHLDCAGRRRRTEIQ